MGTPTTYRGTYEVSDETFENLPDALPKVGHGAYRAAYDMGDVVVKVAGTNVDDGWNMPLGKCRQSNIRERDNWLEIKGTENARGFAAVLACAEDGSWLVQEKALGNIYELVGEKFDLGEMYAETWIEVYWDAYVDLGLSDIHSMNVGLMADGRIVCFDYGGYF